MDLVGAAMFLLSALARYTRNFLDACGYVAGEISDARYEPEVQRMLRSAWATATWAGALAASAICVFYAGFAGGVLQALGNFMVFASGYWVLDRIPFLMPQAKSPHFVRLIHRRLEERLNSSGDSELKRSSLDLAARIKARFADKLA